MSFDYERTIGPYVRRNILSDDFSVYEAARKDDLGDQVFIISFSIDFTQRVKKSLDEHGVQSRDNAEIFIEALTDKIMKAPLIAKLIKKHDDEKADLLKKILSKDRKIERLQKYANHYELQFKLNHGKLDEDY